MVRIDFEYDPEMDWLSLKFPDPRYKMVSKIDGKGWDSESLEEDIENVLRCKAGTFLSDDGQDSFLLGYEYSPGLILVHNNDRALVIDAYNDHETYLILQFDELLDILYQMRDFLKSIGK